MEKKMFCYQCQEALNNTGCTVNGVCGKTFGLSSLMDIFKTTLKSLSRTIVEAKASGKDTEAEELFVMDSLFKLITNANFDEDVFKDEINKALNYNIKLQEGEKQEAVCYDFARLEEQWQDVYGEPIDDADLSGARELIMTGLMGLAAYHSHAHRLGFVDPDINDFTIKTLATMDDIKSLEALIALVDETGAYGLKGMALLDKANTTAFQNPEMSQVNIGVSDRPGILVSGHDLQDLKELLEQSQGSGIDIYTHSEMLPAHYYPELKKYDNLVGNYGGAWHTQRDDFSNFNGPILFTTNCIVPPLKNANYADRLYATGNAGHPGFTYIPLKDDGTKDFSEIIAHAQKCLPPREIESGVITGGFAHNQVMALADSIIENINSGAIRKFVVMAGCDGRQKERKYYTEFAQALPVDTVILTAGCAKYRYIKLNLGDINGIPRVLDAGQCNDSYSLVNVALQLKDALGLDDVNELPISYNIAWYEQKAVIVLLTLLHLNIQNIKLGPTLPAFVTPQIADFLINNFNISTIGDVTEDIKAIG